MEQKVDTEPRSYECSACSAEVTLEDEKCPKCGADISELDEDVVLEAEESIETARPEETISQTSSYSTALRICGAIDLIAGIIGGVAVWSNGNSGFYMGLALGLAFQGFVTFALFNVIADMADDLRAIRLNATHED